MATVFILLIIALVILGAWAYWRFVWFFRDPKREAPKGNNIVSPADGRVVYVKKVKKGIIPISEKKGKKISLKEDVKMETHGEKYLVGVFMTPFNVHVQRAPISGKVTKIKHYQHKNLVMTLMWLRLIFHLKPFYKHCHHMWENERNIIKIEGKFPVYVIQIADLVVNKVVCWVKKGKHVSKGDRIGMIKMGSQVDLVFPTKNMKIAVKVGQKVKAGETIIATFK